MELNFGDIKKMDYDDRLPFEFVLVDLLYKKLINVNEILVCYTEALDKERHLNAMRFEEACINLTQMLSKNFKKKEDKETMHKRAIHTFNLSNSLPKQSMMPSMVILSKMKKNGMNFVNQCMELI